MSQVPITEKVGQSTKGRSTWTVQVSTEGDAAVAGPADKASAALANANVVIRRFDEPFTMTPSLPRVCTVNGRTERDPRLDLSSLA